MRKIEDSRVNFAMNSLWAIQSGGNIEWDIWKKNFSVINVK